MPPVEPTDYLAELRRPFAPDAIRWKVQSTWGGKDGPRRGGMVVPYVDARTVLERLDHVCGLNWEETTQPVVGNPNAMICHLTIDGVTRSDVGESTHSLKGAASDALKRAAVRFGVAASIYAMNRVMLNASPSGGMVEGQPTLKQKERGGKHTLELTPIGESWLREKYGAWVEKQDFGEVLDHGETAETLGLEGADQQMALEDADTEAKIIELTRRYDALTDEQRARKLNGAKSGLTKAKFNAQLRAARDSAEDLALLEAELEERTTA